MGERLTSPDEAQMINLELDKTMLALERAGLDHWHVRLTQLGEALRDVGGEA